MSGRLSPLKWGEGRGARLIRGISPTAPAPPLGMQRNSDDGVVLLIGSGRRAYREYLIRGLASRAPLWLIDEEPATWQSGYLAGSSVVALLDPARIVPDEPGLIDAA